MLSSDAVADPVTLKQELASGIRKDNPHARDYTRTRTAYEKYWQKVEELTAKRDAAGGAEHWP